MTPQDQLRELIRGKGVTIVDLSKQSGVPRTVIHRFLRGEAVGSDKLQAIAKSLDCQLRFVQNRQRTMNILTVEQAKEYVCNLPFELAIVDNQPCVKVAEGQYTTDLKMLMRITVENCMKGQSGFDRTIVSKGIQAASRHIPDQERPLFDILSQELDNALNIYNEKMD